MNIPGRSQALSVPSVKGLLQIIWSQPWVRLLIYCLLVFLGWRLAQRLKGVIILGLVAFTLAYLVNPLIVWLQRRHIPRALGVLGLVVVLTLFAGVSLWGGITQLGTLVAQFPHFVLQIGKLGAALVERLRGLPGLHSAPEQMNTALAANLQAFNRNALPTLQRIVGPGSSFLGGAIGVVGWLGQLAFALTLAIYFMLDYPRLGPSVLRLFPESWQPIAKRLSTDIGDSFGGYVRGQLLIGLGAGVLVSLSLLMLGIPNALGLGLLMAVLNIVPYIGLVIASVPALLLAVSGGTVKIVLVLAVYFITNQLVGSVLSPYVLGKTSNLSPAAVLLALLVGLTLGGLVGGLLAVPAATLLKHWTEQYWIKSPTHGSEPKQS